MLPIRMARGAVIFFVLLCAMRASALTIHFSGVITSATDGSYHFAPGQTFDGTVSYDPFYDPTVPFHNHGFLGAYVQVNTPTPGILFMPDLNILFMPDLNQFNIGPGSLSVIGNPIEFWGGFTLLMDGAGAVTGGSIGVNSEALRGNGGFSGVINSEKLVEGGAVPDVGSTLALLLLAVIALGAFICFRRSALAPTSDL
jgi:hypothetical protein